MCLTVLRILIQELTDLRCMQVYDYYAGGADTESTVRDNRAVFGRYRLLPRYMVDVSHCDLTYHLLGKSSTSPGQTVAASPELFLLLQAQLICKSMLMQSLMQLWCISMLQGVS